MFHRIGNFLTSFLGVLVISQFLIFNCVAQVEESPPVEVNECWVTFSPNCSNFAFYPQDPGDGSRCQNGCVPAWWQGEEIRVCSTPSMTYVINSNVPGVVHAPAGIVGNTELQDHGGVEWSMYCARTYGCECIWNKENDDPPPTVCTQVGGIDPNQVVSVKMEWVDLESSTCTSDPN